MQLKLLVYTPVFYVAVKFLDIYLTKCQRHWCEWRWITSFIARNHLTTFQLEQDWQEFAYHGKLMFQVLMAPSLVNCINTKLFFLPFFFLSFVETVLYNTFLFKVVKENNILAWNLNVFLFCVAFLINLIFFTFISILFPSHFRWLIIIFYALRKGQQNVLLSHNWLLLCIINLIKWIFWNWKLIFLNLIFIVYGCNIA